MNKFLDKIFKKKLNIENLDYIIFGRFYSDNYGTYEIYKLTQTNLLVDKREIWHNKRHSKDGYEFVGDIMPKVKYELTKNLINQVPFEILNKNLKGFFTTGNKNEDKLIIEIFDGKIKKSITIDRYEIETEKLPKKLKTFRYLVESILNNIN